MLFGKKFVSVTEYWRAELDDETIRSMRHFYIDRASDDNAQQHIIPSDLMQDALSVDKTYYKPVKNIIISPDDIESMELDETERWFNKYKNVEFPIFLRKIYVAKKSPMSLFFVITLHSQKQIVVKYEDGMKLLKRMVDYETYKSYEF